jgi:hypothetical protein
MFIHRTLTVVFVQVLLSEVDDDVLFPQKVGNPLPEVTVKPPTRAIGTCFLIILSQWWLMVAALTEAKFGTIAHPSFVAWHGSTVFMVPEVNRKSTGSLLAHRVKNGYICLKIGDANT